jgi:hypothetical protein
MDIDIIELEESCCPRRWIVVPGEVLRVPVDHIPDWWLRMSPRDRWRWDGALFWRCPSHWISHGVEGVAILSQKGSRWWHVNSQPQSSSLETRRQKGRWEYYGSVRCQRAVSAQGSKGEKARLAIEFPLVIHTCTLCGVLGTKVEFEKGPARGLELRLTTPRFSRRRCHGSKCARCAVLVN